MGTILLILKIFGLVVSGASVIGSERLKKIEIRLRLFLDKRNLALVFRKMLGALLFPLFKQRESLSKNLMSTSFSFSSFLRERLAEWNKHLILRIDARPRNQLLNILVSLLLIMVQLALFPVAILLSLVFLAILGAAVSLSFSTTILLSLLTSMLVLVITGALGLLASCFWVISRPYTWLDSVVQKREIESTIVVIGILVAVVAEILGNYLK